MPPSNASCPLASSTPPPVSTPPPLHPSTPPLPTTGTCPISYLPRISHTGTCMPRGREWSTPRTPTAGWGYSLGRGSRTQRPPRWAGVPNDAESVVSAADRCRTKQVVRAREVHALQTVRKASDSLIRLSAPSGRRVLVITIYSHTAPASPIHGHRLPKLTLWCHLGRAAVRLTQKLNQSQARYKRGPAKLVLD